jgi:hypothetical protein
MQAARLRKFNFSDFLVETLLELPEENANIRALEILPNGTIFLTSGYG